MVEEKEDNFDSNQRLTLFIDLFSQHQRQLHLYVLSLVFEAADAYDILQDTNLVLWEKFDSYQLGTNFLAWARKIAFHRVLRFREAKTKRMTSLDPHVLESLASTTSGQALEVLTARQDALEGCLDKLRQEDRKLIETAI